MFWRGLFICLLVWGGIAGCVGKRDLGGSFTPVSGNCNSDRIDIKRVEGFGNKYYLVTVYTKKGGKGSREFLGVAEGNVIIIFKGTKMYGGKLNQAGRIDVSGKGIRVRAEGKDCFFLKRNE